MTQNTDEYGTGMQRLLIHVVLPAGTGIWAFTQAPGGPAWSMWLLIALAVGSLFYAFNRLLKIADERLNPEINRDEVVDL